MSNTKDFKNITSIDNKRPAKQLKPVKQAQEWANQIQSMKDKRDEKLENAKKMLVNSIKIASDRYATANGVMQAIDVMNMINPHGDVSIKSAAGIALIMHTDLKDLSKVAEDLDYLNLDKLCDDFYEHDLVNKIDIDYNDFVLELLHLNACQKFGPDASDIKDFMLSANDDITSLTKKLEELCADNSLEIPGPEIKKD